MLTWPNFTLPPINLWSLPKVEKYEKDIEWLLKHYPNATEKQQDIFSEKCGIIQDHLPNASDETIRNNVLEIMLNNGQI